MYTLSIRSPFDAFSRDISFQTEGAMYAYFFVWVFPDDEVYYFIGDEEYTPWWAR